MSGTSCVLDERLSAGSQWHGTVWNSCPQQEVQSDRRLARQLGVSGLSSVPTPVENEVRSAASCSHGRAACRDGRTNARTPRGVHGMQRFAASLGRVLDFRMKHADMDTCTIRTSLSRPEKRCFWRAYGTNTQPSTTRSMTLMSLVTSFRCFRTRGWFFSRTCLPDGWTQHTIRPIGSRCARVVL